MFKEYRKAHDEMENNSAIADLREALNQAQEALAQAEKPYRERIAKAADEIKATVLEQGKSVTLFDVEASYKKGRRSTSWKKIAEEMNPPESIISRHTKYGNPSVSVKVLCPATSNAKARSAKT